MRVGVAACVTTSAVSMISTATRRWGEFRTVTYAAATDAAFTSLATNLETSVGITGSTSRLLDAPDFPEFNHAVRSDAHYLCMQAHFRAQAVTPALATTTATILD